jgi:hypothetical protein
VRLGHIGHVVGQNPTSLATQTTSRGTLFIFTYYSGISILDGKGAESSSVDFEASRRGRCLSDKIDTRRRDGGLGRKIISKTE